MVSLCMASYIYIYVGSDDDDLFLFFLVFFFWGVTEVFQPLLGKAWPKLPRECPKASEG